MGENHKKVLLFLKAILKVLWVVELGRIISVLDTSLVWKNRQMVQNKWFQGIYKSMFSHANNSKNGDREYLWTYDLDMCMPINLFQGQCPRDIPNKSIKKAFP